MGEGHPPLAVPGAEQVPDGQSGGAALDDGGPGDDAGVVPPVDGEGGVLPGGVVHRLLFFVDAGGGFYRGAEDYRHPVGNAAVDPGVLVGGGGNPPGLVHPEGVVGLAAPQIGKAEPGPELNPLDGGNRESHVGQNALHAVEEGLSHPGGQAQDGGFENTAHAVPLAARGPDGGLHGLLSGIVQQGEALGFLFQLGQLGGQGGGVILGKGKILHPGAAADVGGNLNPGLLQSGQHNGSPGHQPGGDPAREVAAAPGILKAVVFDIGGVVRVARPEQGRGAGVVPAAGVLVLNHQGDGGAGGPALPHARKDLDGVGLHPGGGKAVSPGPAGVHAPGQECFVHRAPGGHPVQYGPHGPAVALAEDGQAEV